MVPHVSEDLQTELGFELSPRLSGLDNHVRHAAADRGPWPLERVYVPALQPPGKDQVRPSVKTTLPYDRDRRNQAN